MRKLKSERADLRSWLRDLKLRVGRIRADRKNKEIDLILSEERIVQGRLKRIDTLLGRSKVLPPVWGHKTEVRPGDTVCLRNHDHIRIILLTAAQGADPANGKIPVTSPIGRTLLGRHLGDRIALHTLDGTQRYEIFKLI